MPIGFRDPTLTAADVVEALALIPDPVNGWYRIISQDTPKDRTQRGAISMLYFLQEGGPACLWHRTDYTEALVWQGGAPLEAMIADSRNPRTVTIGPVTENLDLAQTIIPADTWTSVRSLGAWTLTLAVNAPAFRYSGFEYAEEGFVPPGWPPNSPSAP